jgi:hypothetical protein
MLSSTAELVIHVARVAVSHKISVSEPKVQPFKVDSYCIDGYAQAGMNPVCRLFNAWHLLELLNANGRARWPSSFCCGLCPGPPLRFSPGYENRRASSPKLEYIPVGLLSAMP